ncbi:MAG: Rieske 2Fe-2S domain-containing protein [Deltaproteobacteria bacterium]|nr:Rieske 2Fe-2S domain-containing protein [Deltaproteobacteria bacterium]
MNPEWVRIAELAYLDRAHPVAARVAGIDVVVVRVGGAPRVLYGRCTHRNALLAEGQVTDGILVCARHGWDYDCATGRSRCDDNEALAVFACEVRDGGVWVDAAAMGRWRLATPMDFYEDELDP